MKFLGAGTFGWITTLLMIAVVCLGRLCLGYATSAAVKKGDAAMARSIRRRFALGMLCFSTFSLVLFGSAAILWNPTLNFGSGIFFIFLITASMRFFFLWRNPDVLEKSAISRSASAGNASRIASPTDFHQSRAFRFGHHLQRFLKGKRRNSKMPH
jgi:hypothetical protein